MLNKVHGRESDHQLKRAWAKFVAFNQELIDKAIPLHLRLKFFHSVVAPTALYGCSSWVMTCAREARLGSAQLEMLRTILGRRRILKLDGDQETWVEWVQRVTAEARQEMEANSIPSWIEEQRCRLQSWRGRLSRMNCERWARRV